MVSAMVAAVTVGSYSGGDDGTHTYDYYISASDWENNVYHDNNHNLFIAGDGYYSFRQDSVVYEGNGSVGLAPVGTLTEGPKWYDAVERSFAESGYGSGSGEGGGYLLWMVPAVEAALPCIAKPMLTYWRS